MEHRARLLLILLACCGPAPSSAVRAPPPPPATIASPVVTHPAEWLFPAAGGRADAELRLADGTVFQVGEQGRRWLVAPDGTTTRAPLLLREPLVDLLARGERFVLVGTRGATFEVREALGPVLATHPAPFVADPTHQGLFAAGKDALLGVRDGALWRSVDGGVNWSSSKLALRPFERVVGLAANPRGEVLVLLHPQRVLVSMDDGASFAPLETPGIGAKQVRRDVAGDLWLFGEKRRAKLSATPPRLVVASGEPCLQTPHATYDAPIQMTRRALVGARMVTLRPTKSGLSVAVSATMPAEGKGFAVSPDPTAFVAADVAGDDGVVVVAVDDVSVAPSRTRILRSEDDGKSWSQVGSFVGTRQGDFRLAAGAGWVLVGQLCDEASSACTPPQVKVGGEAWAPLTLPSSVRRHEFLFDAGHGRVVLFAERDDGNLLLTSPSARAAFAPVAVALPTGKVLASTTDARGDVILAYASPERLVKVTLGGAPQVQAPVALPFHHVDIGLAGARGYAQSATRAWETNDGGAHWAAVAPGAGEKVRCTVLGCVTGSMIRAGWDLLPDEIVTPPTSVAAKIQPTPVTKDVTIHCTPTSGWKKLAAELPGPAAGLFEGDVRFVSPIDSDADVRGFVVARGTAAPVKVELLGAVPKGAHVIHVWSRSRRGIVLARLRYLMGPIDGGFTGIREVEVELGWYSTALGKVVRAKLFLPKFTDQFVEVVEGGVLFLPLDGTEFTFVSDAGKVQQLPAPDSHANWSGAKAVKLGQRIALAAPLDWQNPHTLALASTDDLGAKWSSSIWTMGSRAELTESAGRFALAVGVGAHLSFDRVAHDPPAMVGGSELLAKAVEDFVGCGKGASGVLVESEASGDRSAVHVEIANKGGVADGLSAQRLVARVGGSSACLATIFAGNASLVAVVTPSDLGHGWLVRADPSANGSEYSALSCSPP